MGLFHTKFDRIKNIQKKILIKDFGYNAVSFLVLGICIGVGIFTQLFFYLPGEVREVVAIAGGIVAAGALISFIPMWITVVLMIMFLWLPLIAFLDIGYYPIALAGSAGLLLSASVQLVYQWDKVVILRMGKFKKVHGPGLFLLFPLVDRIAAFIDTRIRATDFSAEKTITKDTVPVHVDALAFWMIWEAKQAVLEVENFLEAVTLSAQTALRAMNMVYEGIRQNNSLMLLPSSALDNMNLGAVLGTAAYNKARDKNDTDT